MEFNMKEVLSLTTGLNSTYKLIDRKLTLEEGFQALFLKLQLLPLNGMSFILFILLYFWNIYKLQNDFATPVKGFIANV